MYDQTAETGASDPLVQRQVASYRRVAMGASGRTALVGALAAILCAACTGPERPRGTTPDETVRQTRTLRMAVKDEVADLAPRLPRSSNTAPALLDVAEYR